MTGDMAPAASGKKKVWCLPARLTVVTLGVIVSSTHAVLPRVTLVQMTAPRASTGQPSGNGLLWDMLAQSQPWFMTSATTPC